MFELYSDTMDTDAYLPTQQQTQSQPQIVEEVFDESVYGVLRPTRVGMPRILLYKDEKHKPTVIYFGRGRECHVKLNSLKISNRHCSFTWFGGKDVAVEDTSSNGTFIEGKKIGKGSTSFLKNGDVISFGTWNQFSSPDEFHYIYRYVADGRPSKGIYASYDIGEQIGRGSFATVFKGICRATGEVVAIKQIHLRVLNELNKDMLDKLDREMDILKQISHPYICQLKESFRDEEKLHLILEHINGSELLEYIIANGGVDEETTRILSYQLCHAVQYIHSMGIAHRDLKPENIMLTSDKPPILKLVDFGLAKAVDHATRFKTTCGTPIYLAPEVLDQSRGSEGYSEIVDSWSVGIVVYAMIMNKIPFPDNTMRPGQNDYKIKEEEWEILREKSSDLCVDFISKLLKIDPNTRMSCAKAILHPWLRVLENSEVAIRAREGPAPLMLKETTSMEANAGSFIGSAAPSSASQLMLGTSRMMRYLNDDSALSDDMEPSNYAHRSRTSSPEPIILSQGQKLERHPLQIAKRGSDGRLEDFETLTTFSQKNHNLDTEDEGCASPTKEGRNRTVKANRKKPASQTGKKPSSSRTRNARLDAAAAPVQAQHHRSTRASTRANSRRTRGAA